MLRDVMRISLLTLVLGLATAARAAAEAPGPELKPDPYGEPSTSPDQQVRIEQYYRDLGDEGFQHQFWSFDNNHQNGFLINPGEGVDVAGYAAGFRFSRDSQWLVRMQKLGAGVHTLFLYRRDGLRFSPATKKPLGDLAFDYFFHSKASRGMRHHSADYEPNHRQAHLLKGLEENYAWLDKGWPDNRYVAISLSFDAQGEKKGTPWISDWWCVYDLKTGAFSVPAGFAEHNAKTRRTGPPA